MGIGAGQDERASASLRDTARATQCSGIGREVGTVEDEGPIIGDVPCKVSGGAADADIERRPGGDRRQSGIGLIAVEDRLAGEKLEIPCSGDAPR